MSATLLVTLVMISALTAFMAARSAASRVDADVARIANTLRSTTFPLTPAVLDQIAGLSGAQLLLTEADNSDAGNSVSASTSLLASSGWIPARQPVDLPATNDDRVTLADETYFHRTVEFRRPSQVDRSLLLHVLYPESTWRQARREAIFPPLVVGAIGAAITAVLSLVLSRRVTQPVTRVAHLMSELASGKYVPAAIPRRNDELRDLTLAANGLAAQLDELHSAIRRGERLSLLGQLSGGLAHQLRNNATGARLAMQLHRRSCGGADRESIEVALRQLELVEEQLVSFLALGKPQPPRQETCDLVAIAEDVGRLVTANFRHRGITFQLHLPAAGASVTGDAAQLRQLLINLTLNALEAAERGGQVRVVLEQLADQARLAVYDSGPGVRDEVADTLFEPFVTTRPEGIGLGLAVATRIASDHGGVLGCSRIDGETCFSLSLPTKCPTHAVTESKPAVQAANVAADAQTKVSEPQHA